MHADLPATTGSTYVIACAAPDLAGSIQWGAPDERDVDAMVRAVDAIAAHPAMAARGAVLMDCRAIDRIEPDVLVQFVELARTRLARWSSRVARQAVVVPDGVSGLLLAGALPMLAPAHAFRFVTEPDAAFAFLDHAGSPALHAALIDAARVARGSADVLARLRGALARDLAGATVERAARTLGTSTRSLQRELLALGTTFSDELRRARVAAADELLRLSAIKIEAIAARVGFGSSARMTAALRTELGMTASERRATSDRCGAGRPSS